MNDKNAISLENDVRALSQKMMLEAGYEANDDWIFIEDLVLHYRALHAAREDLLQDLNAFIEANNGPVTRKQLKRFIANALHQDRIEQQNSRQQKQVQDVCAQMGISEPDERNQALARRIIELENAVQLYAKQLMDLQTSAANKPTGLFPFVAGVVVGGVLF